MVIFGIYGLYTKALDIYFKISKKHPDSYKVEMGKIVGNMLDVQKRTGKAANRNSFFTFVNFFRWLRKIIHRLF